MIRNIRSAFIDLLDESTWMDDTSKRLAIDKVSLEERLQKNVFRTGFGHR